MKIAFIISFVIVLCYTSSKASAQVVSIPYQQRQYQQLIAAPMSPVGCQHTVLTFGSPYCGQSYTAYNGRLIGQFRPGQSVLVNQVGQPCFIPMEAGGQILGWTPIILITAPMHQVIIVVPQPRRDVRRQYYPRG